MPTTKREKRISRMKKRGLRLTKTEQELLIGMGFDRRLISSWAAGDKMPDKFNAALIAGIVGRPLAEILFGNSFPRKKMKRGRPKKRKNITA